MDTQSIIAALEAERDRLDRAIAALQNLRGPRRRGKAEPAAGNGRIVRRRLSAAARKRISEVAKKRWAKAKAAGKNYL